MIGDRTLATAVHRRMSDFEHPDPIAPFPFRLADHLKAEGYDLVGRALMEGLQAYATVVTE